MGLVISNGLERYKVFLLAVLQLEAGSWKLEATAVQLSSCCKRDELRFENFAAIPGLKPRFLLALFTGLKAGAFTTPRG
jgi:hypothetical protein